MVYSSSNETEEIPQYSIALPQTLQGLGAMGGDFYTKLPIDCDENNLITNYDFYIKLHTSRGKKTIKVNLQDLLENKVR